MPGRGPCEDYPLVGWVVERPAEFIEWNEKGEARVGRCDAIENYNPARPNALDRHSFSLDRVHYVRRRGETVVRLIEMFLDTGFRISGCGTLVTWEQAAQHYEFWNDSAWDRMCK